MTYIVMDGNITSGYELVGPFDGFEEAAEWDNGNRGGINWIMELNYPHKLSDSELSDIQITLEEGIAQEIFDCDEWDEENPRPSEGMCQELSWNILRYVIFNLSLTEHEKLRELMESKPSSIPKEEPYDQADWDPFYAGLTDDHHEDQ